MPVTTEPIQCDLEILGFSVEGEEADKIKAICDLYFIDFIKPCDCILCGRTLGGILGTFTWTITHGEGHCGNCEWPARGIHYIKDTDESDIFTSPLRMILQYHPKAISDEGFEELISRQEFSSEIDRINELRKYS